MYRWVEHTAELELELEAPAQEDVFREALAAYAELAGGAAGPAAAHEVTLEAEEPALLLVDWLGELIYLGETAGFVPDRVDALELGEGRLRATVSGRTGAESHPVKGVTLHRLELAESGGGWRARVVLDV